MPHSEPAKRKRIGVIGLGAVGKAFSHTMSWFHDVVGYDVVGNHVWESILNTSAVFVCVSTPEGKTGRLDCSNVTDVLRRLSDASYAGNVVIRSTLRVGFMDESVREFPQLRLVYSPEFLRERSRFQWSVNPDRLVLSGAAPDIDEVRLLFDWIEDAPTLIMSYREAELGKLAHNAYIATKVSFTNEIEQICEKYDADPTKVMSVVTSDRRVRSREHLTVGLGPYQGSCVPKDTRELLSAGGEAPLLRAVELVNRGAMERWDTNRSRIRNCSGL
jgi:UDPglucose 6-dehydrogenase